MTTTTTSMFFDLQQPISLSDALAEVESSSNFSDEETELIKELVTHWHTHGGEGSLYDHAFSWADATETETDSLGYLAQLFLTKC